MTSGYMDRCEEKLKLPKKQKVIVLPADIQAIANPSVDVKLIDDFIKCVCGNRVCFANADNEMITFKCSSGWCRSVYSYPIDHQYFIFGKEKTSTERKVQAMSLLAPQKIPEQVAGIDLAKQIKSCKVCGTEITIEQAHSSFNFIGRALCEACLGDELV